MDYSDYKKTTQVLGTALAVVVFASGVMYDTLTDERDAYRIQAAVSTQEVKEFKAMKVANNRINDLRLEKLKADALSEIKVLEVKLDNTHESLSQCTQENKEILDLFVKSRLTKENH